MTYTVPSRFIGERLYVQLYDERLELFSGHEKLLTLARVYASKTQRGRNVDYRHVIDSLVKKPGAFRFSQLRDDLLPTPDYQRIWQYADDNLNAHDACRYIVRLLHLAATEQCQDALGRYVLKGIERGKLPGNLHCNKHFAGDDSVIPLITARQHTLNDYDQLLSSVQEVHHG